MLEGSGNNLGTRVLVRAGGLVCGYTLGLTLTPENLVKLIPQVAALK